MCWSHRELIRDSWSSERVPRDTGVRVSDADREAMIAKLSHHTGEGRLTLDEFEARVDEALKAKTRGELDHVLRELPREREPIRRRASSRQTRMLVFWIAIITLAAIAMGPGSLWWTIPLFWFTGGFGTFRHHGHHRHRSPRWHELEPADEELTTV